MDQDCWELSVARGRRWGGQDNVLGEGWGQAGEMRIEGLGVVRWWHLRAR